VGAHFGDVAVLPVAEFGVVVASSGVHHGGCAARSCGGHCVVRVAHNLRQGVRVCSTCNLRV
jgi:hypothetical protein